MPSHSRPPVPESASPPPFPGLPQQEIEGAEADLFDYAKLRNYASYVLHATVERRWLVATVFTAMVLTAVGALAVLPKSYHCDIKIQAQRNMVISTLAGLNRSYDWDMPTRAAADVVLRHDNLVSIVRRTDLVRQWSQSRAPILRLKDAVTRRVRGELSDDFKEDMLVGTLEQRLSVQVTEDTVTIGIDWPDPKMAYRLIQAAHENFLEARQYKEISAVSEAIGLLEARAADARERVNAALEKVEKLKPQKQPRAPAVEAPRAPARRAPTADPDLLRIRGQLQAKRALIFEMEEFRKRRIADLASRLSELKQVYSEFHPTVVDLEQTLQQQEREENPQLGTLRQEYQQLEEEYERRGGPALEPSNTLSSAKLPAAALQISRSVPDEAESPEMEQTKAELKHEIGRYSSMQEKIDQARMELETQRAAFRYRYSVLRPAAVPLTPRSPNKPLVLALAVALGALLGVLAATLAQIRSGRVYQRWQVERQLGLAVLAEVPLP